MSLATKLFGLVMLAGVLSACGQQQQEPEPIPAPPPVIAPEPTYSKF